MAMEPMINRPAAERAATEMEGLLRELHDATGDALETARQKGDPVTNRDFAELFVSRMALATKALQFATAHRELSFALEDPAKAVGD